MKKIYVDCNIFSIKMVKSIVPNSKVIFAIFIHLHNVKIMDNRNVKTIIKRRKMSFVLNSCLERLVSC